MSTPFIPPYGLTSIDPVWGTGKVYVPSGNNSVFGLNFCTSFSTFKFQPRSYRQPHQINEEYVNRYWNQFSHEGWDLIKWEFRMEDRIWGRVRVKYLVIKTRYIIMLQRRIRKFIATKRREKLIRYLLRLFGSRPGPAASTRPILCSDVIRNFSAFLV